MKNGSLIAILYRLFRRETVMSTFGLVYWLFLTLIRCSLNVFYFPISMRKVTKGPVEQIFFYQYLLNFGLT